MARTVLTDHICKQLQSTMKAHGYYNWKNDRQIMEAIPSELCSWKTAYSSFSRLLKRVCGNDFVDLEVRIDEE